MSLSRCFGPTAGVSWRCYVSNRRSPTILQVRSLVVHRHHLAAPVHDWAGFRRSITSGTDTVDGSGATASSSSSAGPLSNIIGSSEGGLTSSSDVSLPAGLEEVMRSEAGAVPSSRRCSGCGAWLHSKDPQEHGYVPAEALAKFTAAGRKKQRAEPMGVPVDWVPDGVEVMRDTSKKYKISTRLPLCVRCYRLQNYHRTDDPVVGGFYRMEGGRDWQHEAEIVEKVVRRLRRQSIVLMVIDILDFESSLVPEMFDACRNRQIPVIYVVNKVDCLPKGTVPDKLERIKVWVRRMSRQVRNVHASDVVLVSAKTGYGFDALEQRLRHHLEPQDPKWIYTLGRVNSGKSTFVNRFMWYIGDKQNGTVHHKSTVGGVTRSPVPGTTLHFVSFKLPKGFRLVDTPGIPSSSQLTNSLTEGIDLYAMTPRTQLVPISYVVHTGRSLLIGALARIDLLEGGLTFVTSFFSKDVTLHVCRTNRADGLLERKAGTFFYPPHSYDDYQNLGPFVRHRVEVFGSSDRAWDDIVIAGFGWISVSGFGTKILDIWVPAGIKIFRRPALLPTEMRHRGVTRFHVNHRARSSKVYRRKNAIVKARRDKVLRDSLRAAQSGLEDDLASPVSLADDVPFVEGAGELADDFDIISK